MDGGAVYGDGEGWRKSRLERLEINRYVFAVLGLSRRAEPESQHKVFDVA